MRCLFVGAIFLARVSAQPSQPAALTALNDGFRAAYAEAKARVLAANGPTLVVNGDTFSLLRDGRRAEANTGTPIYDPVKSIAHITLAIYVILIGVYAWYMNRLDIEYGVDEGDD